MTYQRNLSSHEGNSGNPGAEDSLFAPAWLRRSLALFRRRFLLVVSAAVLGGAFAHALASSAPPEFQSAVRIFAPDAAEPPGGQVPLFGALTHGTGAELLLPVEVLREIVVGQQLARLPEFAAAPRSWLGERLEGMKRRISDLSGGFFDKYLDGALDPPSIREPSETILIERLRDAIEVGVESGRNVMEFSVTADSPDTAKLLAAAVGGAFIAERDRQQKARLSEDFRLHSERVIRLHAAVVAAEGALDDFVASRDMGNLEMRSAQIELRSANLNFEIVRLQVELAGLRIALDRILAAIAENGDLGALPEVQASEPAAALRAERLALEQSLNDLRLSNASEAAIASLTLQLAEIDRQLAAESQRIVKGLRDRIFEIEATERQLQAGLSELVAESHTIGTYLIAMNDLQRQVDIQRDVYVAFLSGRDPEYDPEAQFVSDARVVQPASRPIGPLTGPVPAITLAGGIAGALSGIIFGAFRERLVRGFVTAGQVETVLRLPVLLSLPRVQKRRYFRKRGDGRFGPSHQNAEDLRGLRHRLTGILGARYAPAVLLTSIGDNEGRTGFAATLARAAEQDGRSVLLIDADLENAGLSKAMKFKDSDGLTELVERASWSLQGVTPRSGILDILPTGRIPGEPLRFIESATLARFLEEARDHYDLIVIDGPSNPISLETLVLSDLCDGNCLIVRWNLSPRKATLDTVRRIGREKFLGVVLTDVDPKTAALYDPTYPRRQGWAPTNRPSLSAHAARPAPVATERAVDCA